MIYIVLNEAGWNGHARGDEIELPNASDVHAALEAGALLGAKDDLPPPRRSDIAAAQSKAGAVGKV